MLRQIRIWRILDALKICFLACLMISRANACDLRRIKKTVGLIKGYVGTGDSLYSLVPHIQDPQSEGLVKNFCDTYPRVRQELLDIKTDCSGAGEIDILLAKLAGYDYMCNAGSGDYGKHSKCISEMTDKLSKECTTPHDTLTDLRKESIYAEAETHSALCTAIDKYMLCSFATISEGCEGASAGNWYRSYMKSVFNKLVEHTTLKCSFGGTTGLLTNNVTTIAIFVGVGVLVLLLLFCFCWCCRAGVCSCCKEDDEEDVKYHMPDSNDNEKDLSGRNSVV